MERYRYLLSYSEKADQVLAEYHEIMNKYNQTGEKFVDNNFVNSLPVYEFQEINKKESSKTPDNIEYKRLEDFYPHDFLKNIDEYGVCQGCLGDCFLVATFVQLSRDPELVKSLFVEPVDIKSGCVCMKFKFLGKPIYVYVDTRVPWLYDAPRYSHPRTKDDSCWFCIAEKCYAKIFGGYSKVKGNSYIALFQICSFTNTTLPADEGIFEKADEFNNNSNFLFCSLDKGYYREYNLIGNHAYALIGTEIINGTKLFHVRNP